MAFDVSTLTNAGAELVKQATSEDTIVFDGCKAFSDYTDKATAVALDTVTPDSLYTTSVTTGFTSDGNLQLFAEFPVAERLRGYKTFVFFGHLSSDTSGTYTAFGVCSAQSSLVPESGDLVEDTVSIRATFTVNVESTSVAVPSSASLVSQAELQNLVHKSGDESISGEKSFVGELHAVKISPAAGITSSIGANDDGEDFESINATSINAAYIFAGTSLRSPNIGYPGVLNIKGNQSVTIGSNGSSCGVQWNYASNALIPVVKTETIGTEEVPFAAMYTTNFTAYTSKITAISTAAIVRGDSTAYIGTESNPFYNGYFTNLYTGAVMPVGNGGEAVGSSDMPFESVTAQTVTGALRRYNAASTIGTSNAPYSSIHGSNIYGTLKPANSSDTVGSYDDFFDSIYSSRVCTDNIYNLAGDEVYAGVDADGNAYLSDIEGGGVLTWDDRQGLYPDNNNYHTLGLSAKAWKMLYTYGVKWTLGNIGNPLNMPCGLPFLALVTMVHSEDVSPVTYAPGTALSNITSLSGVQIALSYGVEEKGTASIASRGNGGSIKSSASSLILLCYLTDGGVAGSRYATALVMRIP